MKVVHIISTLSAGGAELHLLTLCKQLKRLGVESVVACLREEVKGSRVLRPDFEREGIRVVNLRGDGNRRSSLSRSFVLLREERPSILHTHLPRADLVGVVAHTLFPSVQWISSVHDIYSKSWSGKWLLPLFRWVWRRADAVVAISHAVKDWLVTEGYTPAKNVTVIHYGIESKVFVQPEPDLREVSGTNRPSLVGSIGRLEPRKAHENLIQAMPIILQKAPNASLLIAGHDPTNYGPKLQSLIDELQLNAHVRLVGFQGNVPSFLRPLNVFALASRSEGFGQVLIEAMAAGKPVVGSRLPPFTEIVVDGETGLLVEPDNPDAFATAIIWLLTHPEESKRMGVNGQKRACNHFSADRMAVATLELYGSCLLAAKSNAAAGGS